MTDTMSSEVLPSLRSANANATRQRLIEAAVAVLESGNECTMRSVAVAAKVSERTIYRYFESRDVLAIAVRDHLRASFGVVFPETLDGLGEYVERLFGMFEQRPELITSLVAQAAGSLRTEFDDSRSTNLELLRNLLDAAFPNAPAADRACAAQSLRSQISGAGWFYLRVSCGVDNDEIIRSGKWAIRRATDYLASR
jgi:AcrR family transcriptional regulator